MHFGIVYLLGFFRQHKGDKLDTDSKFPKNALFLLIRDHFFMILYLTPYYTLGMY